jgi:predicted MPP superfamily phosphohydrolase
MGPTDRISRRAFLKKILIAAGSAAAVGSLGGVYSFFGERYWLQVKNIELSYRHLPEAFAGVRVVQFSDTHLGRFYSYRHFTDVITTINRLQPDVLCFTGDLFDAMYGKASQDCVPFLSQLKAPLGKWAVLGNHDYRSNARTVSAILAEGGFTVLVNDHHAIEKDGQRITIVGTDEMLHGHPDIRRALRGVEADDFTLLLAHEPDFADIAGLYPIDLQLSGHSHGGQVRLPLIGPLSRPEYGAKYVDGLYAVPQSKLQVYVNRGIGTTLLPFRFLCRPEITVFTLNRG